MVEDNKLDLYGDLYSKMLAEGDGYYFYGYESPSTFDFDPELQSKFNEAATALEAFKECLEERIMSEGGSPEDYEV